MFNVYSGLSDRLADLIATTVDADADYLVRPDMAIYDESSVPDDANLPYITYQVSTDFLGNPQFMTASITLGDGATLQNFYCADGERKDGDA